jgi:hypothetical protein
MELFTLEQINLNVALEEMILDYKSELFKTGKKKNIYDYRVKLYKNNINKFEKYKTNSKSKELEIRAELYLKTCEQMIEKSSNHLNEIINEIREKEEFLKYEIWNLLFEAITNGFINDNTILKKNNYLIYTLPSAKIYFKKIEIIIEDEEELYNFLSKDIDLKKDYIDKNNKILFDLLKNNLSISEDGTISDMNGVIFSGLSTSDPEVKLELNQNKD